MYIINSHNFVQEVVKKVYHTVLAIAWLVLTRYMQFFCQAISKKGNIIVSRSVTCQDRTDDELRRIFVGQGTERAPLFVVVPAHDTRCEAFRKSSKEKNCSNQMDPILVLWFNHIPQNSMNLGFAKPFVGQSLLNVILFQ